MAVLFGNAAHTKMCLALAVLKIWARRAILVLLVGLILPIGTAFGKAGPRIPGYGAAAPGDAITCEGGAIFSGDISIYHLLIFKPIEAPYSCDAGASGLLLRENVTPEPGSIIINIVADGSDAGQVQVAFDSATFSNVSSGGNAAHGQVAFSASCGASACTTVVRFTIAGFNYSASVAWDGQGGVSTTTYSAGSPVASTQQELGSFSENRANALRNVQPNFGSFVAGAAGFFNANGTENNLTASYAASVILDPASQSISDSFDAVDKASRVGMIELWTQIYGANTDAGNANSKLWVGYVGAHTFLTQDMLIGALVQVDYAQEANKVAGSNAHGTGWMFGPYIAGKITGQDVFYEARFSVGGSNNKISPTGAYTDTYKTGRWMASGKLSGAYDLGDVTFSPNIGVSYFSETQSAYTDSLSNAIPQQTVTSGEIAFGPEISKTIALENGASFIPKAGLSVIYTYNATSTNAAQTFAVDKGDLRAKLDVGFAFITSDGLTISSTVFYDGVGINNFNVWGGEVKLVVPLN